MAEIDVGAKPNYSTYSDGKTSIEYTNPAGVDFVVDTVEIFLKSSLNHTITVGAFSGSNPFTSQDSISLGTVYGAGSYHTYTGLSIDFRAGERIGMYDSRSTSYGSWSGSGRRYVGNAFGAGELTYITCNNTCLYGTGETATAGSIPQPIWWIN